MFNFMNIEMEVDTKREDMERRLRKRRPKK